MRRFWQAAVVPALISLLPSCAEEVKDVNRVQPHYFKKAMLDGEWYYRQTIVDVPPDVGIGFVGLEGKVEKVKFEFYGDALHARRTHEGIRGLDEDETRPGATFEGDTILRVSGVEHFDIVRDYNSANGTQSNVLNEDSSLRPWFERDFFRADWSSAAAVGQDFAKLFATFSTGTYWARETEIANPDHFQADLEDGTISFTTSYTVTDGGYTCFIEYGFYRTSTNTRNSCGLGEVKVRHSFVRIDPEDAAQFEPRSYLDREFVRDENGAIMYSLTVSVPKPDGGVDYVDVECTDDVLEQLRGKYRREDCKPLTHNQMGRFGFFRTERYDANRRLPNGHDELRNFYANHHKIWEQVYAWEMTEDETGAPVIARDEAGKPKLKRDADGNPVVIPVKDRKVRPIVYHLNVNFPEDLKGTAQEIAADWDRLFVNAIASAQGKSPEALRAELKKQTGHGAAYRIDDNDCRREVIDAYLERVPELVDVVRSVTHADDLDSDAVDAGNPNNILAGNLEPVCSALTAESRARGLEKFTYQQVGDVRWNFVYWVNEDQPSGPLGFGPSGPDAETGRIISGNAYVYGAAVDGYARDSMDLVRFLNGDIDDAFEDIASGKTITDWLDLRNKSVADQPLTVTEAQRAALKQRFSTFQAANPESFRSADGKVDLSRMSHDMVTRSELKRADDPMFAQAAGPDPMDLMKQRLRDNPELRTRMLPRPVMSMLYRLFQWDPNAHEGEDMPEDLLEATIEVAANPAAISEHMQKRADFYIERNITLPEFYDDAVIGRALSLKGRDPVEVYEDLRKEIFRGVMLHEIGHTLGMTHNFRASHDALNYFDTFWDLEERYDTDEERDEHLQPEYRYTSIMDYGARFNSDFHGLGKYDQAAIKFAYTGLIEAFDESVEVPSRLDLHLEYDHYTKIPQLLGGSTANLTRREDRLVDEVIAEAREGIRENGKRFAESPDAGAEGYWRDRTVPYFYCFDYFNGRDPKCRTWDEGPTHEEAVRSAIQRYWNYYFFNSWRRGRDEYQFYLGFFSRMGRLLPYLNYPYKHYSFFQQYVNRDGTPMDLTEDLLRAAMIATDFTMQVVGAPEPGWYCKANTGNSLKEQITYVPYWAFGFNPDYFRSEACDRMELPLGVGRDMYIDLSDDYQTKYEYMGSFFEKQNFIIPLLNAGNVFIRPPVNAAGEIDLRFGFYDVFKDRLLDLTLDLLDAGLGNFGHRAFQWSTTKNEKGEAVHTFPTMFDFSTVDGRLPGHSEAPVDENGDEIEPVQIWTNTPFDLMRYWLFAGTQLNSRPGDTKLDFYEYIAVQEKGSGDDRAIADGALVATFENPKTGQIFQAPQTRDGLSVAYRLLRVAKQAAEDWNAAKRAFDADPENPQRENDLENADQTLEFYLSTIDDMRLLRSVMDLGK
jgi:hypothetical protein